ncbi:hypothetical protein [Streptomyces halobius]|uniref:Uncharacterized protein n=1 Tax=Streptomyces halobius TaxID=2879846 RepID=A0ABY4MDV3_9ACTN|nr:hypothetical protein [Streptomyces halobius]UQA95643.1 hypothetical protein K9S39_30645 [Streptomyces halobius]
MSDEREQILQELMKELGLYTAGLTITLVALPIPIKLPGNEGGGVNLARELLPAVIRAYEIVNEQPLPEEQQAWACAALLHWILATESILVYPVNAREYRADAAVLNMRLGKAVLADLLEWLNKQDDIA